MTCRWWTAEVFLAVANVNQLAIGEHSGLNMYLIDKLSDIFK